MMWASMFQATIISSVCPLKSAGFEDEGRWNAYLADTRRQWGSDFWGCICPNSGLVGQSPIEQVIRQYSWNISINESLSHLVVYQLLIRIVLFEHTEKLDDVGVLLEDSIKKVQGWQLEAHEHQNRIYKSVVSI